MTRYLKEPGIDAIIGEIDLDASFELMSMDSYNETKILQAIEAGGHKKELLMCTLIASLIGVGNRKYGNFKLGGKIVECSTVLAAYDVKIGLTKDSKLSESDLTIQRLCRVFRYKIKKYLIKNVEAESYLFRKYTDQDNKFRTICFRGSEYLDDLTKEQVDYILQMYETMSSKIGLDLTDKMTRIFIASGKLQKSNFK